MGSGHGAARLMESTSPAWLTALVALLGPAAALAGVFASIYIDRKRGDREAAQVARAQAAERDAERDAFQRQTLLDAQDALLRFARNIMQVYLHDLTEHRHQRDGGRWGSTRHADELSEQMRQNLIAVRLLSGRLLDPGVRDAVTVAAQALNHAVDSAPDEAVAVQRLEAAMEAMEHAQEMLASGFRSIA